MSAWNGFPTASGFCSLAMNRVGHPRTFMQDGHGGKPTPITPEGMIATRVSPDQKYVTVADGGKLSLFPIAGGEPKPIADYGSA